MRVALVVAMAENRVIGRNGGLPWRMSSDLRWFKEVTLGKPVIMGRTTFESIGHPLPGRTNIILSRGGWEAPEGVISARTLSGALEEAEATRAEEACVIGGGQVYAQALSSADRIYLTRIEAEVEGDAYFPALEARDWTVTPLRRIEADDKNEFAASVEQWDRR
jgi:dihydrofolate reductase